MTTYINTSQAANSPESIFWLEKSHSGRVSVEDIRDDLEEFQRLFNAGIATKAETLTLHRAFPDSVTYTEAASKLQDEDDSEPLVIGGPASVELIDREGHLITTQALKKAFEKFMSNFRTRNAMVLHSDVQVGWALPAYISRGGQIFKSGVDDKGLFFICELRGDTAIAKKVEDQISKGLLKSYSIAGSATKIQNMQKGQTPYMQVDEMELAEVTVCEKGVNQGASFEILKAEMPQTGKIDKDQCGYRDATPVENNIGINCGHCKYYNAEDRTCDVVVGDIMPNDYCKLFEACEPAQPHKESIMILRSEDSQDIDFTSTFVNCVSKESKKDDPLTSGKSFATLNNVAGREAEHHQLLREYGFPSEVPIDSMRYVPVFEVETDEKGVPIHNLPPWVVNEAGESLGDRLDEDAPTYESTVQKMGELFLDKDDDYIRTTTPKGKETGRESEANLPWSSGEYGRTSPTEYNPLYSAKKPEDETEDSEEVDKMSAVQKMGYLFNIQKAPYGEGTFGGDPRPQWFGGDPRPQWAQRMRSAERRGGDRRFKDARKNPPQQFTPRSGGRRAREAQEARLSSYDPANRPSETPQGRQRIDRDADIMRRPGSLDSPRGTPDPINRQRQGRRQWNQILRGRRGANEGKYRGPRGDTQGDAKATRITPAGWDDDMYRGPRGDSPGGRTDELINEKERLRRKQAGIDSRARRGRAKMGRARRRGEEAADRIADFARRKIGEPVGRAARQFGEGAQAGYTADPEWDQFFGGPGGYDRANKGNNVARRMGRLFGRAGRRGQDYAAEQARQAPGRARRFGAGAGRGIIGREDEEATGAERIGQLFGRGTRATGRGIGRGAAAAGRFARDKYQEGQQETQRRADDRARERASQERRENAHVKHQETERLGANVQHTPAGHKNLSNSERHDNVNQHLQTINDGGQLSPKQWMEVMHHVSTDRDTGTRIASFHNIDMDKSEWHKPVHFSDMRDHFESGRIQVNHGGNENMRSAFNQMVDTIHATNNQAAGSTPLTLMPSKEQQESTIKTPLTPKTEEPKPQEQLALPAPPPPKAGQDGPYYTKSMQKFMNFMKGKDEVPEGNYESLLERLPPSDRDLRAKDSWKGEGPKGASHKELFDRIYQRIAPTKGPMQKGIEGKGNLEQNSGVQAFFSSLDAGQVFTGGRKD